MLKYLINISILIISSSFLSGYAQSNPLKYIYGCEIDLDKNGKLDLVLLIENSNGPELIVLLWKKNGYQSYLLEEDCNNMNLSCSYGSTIVESSAGSYQGREFRTNGTYILLSQLESSKVAFFWNGNSFQKVWLAD